MNAVEYVKDLCLKVRKARFQLANANTDRKNSALKEIADALTENKEYIINENLKDIEKAKENGIPLPMIDRLKLDEKRIKGISDSIYDIVKLQDPIGSGEVTLRPNGLKIQKTRVPLGTVAIIYESRPNVTADAATLCIKSGNGVILKGGKEAINSNRAIVNVMKNALEKSGFSPDIIGFIDSIERQTTDALMQMRGYVDVLIPRGGKGLIRAVVDNAKVPVIETGAGNCHIYIDEFADLTKALKVAVNAKTSRPSVCNAVETMLVHKDVAEKFLPMFAKETEKFGLEIRGCQKTTEILPGAKTADLIDYDTEYDDFIIACKVVNDLSEAIEHIKTYSTGHSEAIITENFSNASRFCSEIDAAAVYVNASTRFTDGGEFGLGAEIGISTQKLHTRGPMGLYDLTTVKYIVEGDGQIR